MADGPRTPPRTGGPVIAPHRGILYVVATPIGNLEDVTLRALRVLREVDVIAAEDTRRTAKLLQYYQIRTPIVSVHAHNERRRADYIIRSLADNRSIALVTDAGTPGIADPGALLVARAREAGFRVEPVPGASALTAALSASGLHDAGHTFVGFPPVAPSARKKWFADLPEASTRTLILFEAPHRIIRTLDELATIFGEQPIILVRELTKVHEEWKTGPPALLARALPLPPKGEFVILIPPRPEMPQALNYSDAQIADRFGQMTDFGRARRVVIREVASQLGLSSKAVYAAIERHKNSGKQPI